MRCKRTADGGEGEQAALSEQIRRQTCGSLVLFQPQRSCGIVSAREGESGRAKGEESRERERERERDKSDHQRAKAVLLKKTLTVILSTVPLTGQQPKRSRGSVYREGTAAHVRDGPRLRDDRSRERRMKIVGRGGSFLCVLFVFVLCSSSSRSRSTTGARFTRNWPLWRSAVDARGKKRRKRARDGKNDKFQAMHASKRLSPLTPVGREESI